MAVERKRAARRPSSTASAAVTAWPRRFEVFRVNLDPTVGAEIRKSRPCVIVSPDEANAYIRTVIVAPLTTGAHAYPTRVPCTFKRRRGHVVIDQLRTVDRVRLVSKLGNLDAATQQKVLQTLAEFFAP
jgi:mRNA interferase MazF